MTSTIPMKLIGLSFGVLLSFNVHGQWSVHQEAADLEFLNTLSVDMVGDQVKLGAICKVDPADFQAEVYGASILTDDWSTLSAFDDFAAGDIFTYVRNLHFFDEEVGLATCSNEAGYGGGDTPLSAIIKTTDGGATWEVKHEVPTQHGFELIEDLDFFDDDHGIAVGVFDDNGAWFERTAWVAVTADGGDSWTEVELPESMDFKGAYGVSIVSETSAYMVLFDQDLDLTHAETQWSIYKTDDRGWTWQEVHTEGWPEDFVNDPWEYAGHSVSDISFANDNVGWLIFRSNYLESYLYKTEDGGETWTVIDHPIKRSEGRRPINFRELYVVNENEILISGGEYCLSKTYGDNTSGCYRGRVLIHTDDSGDSWDIIVYGEGGPGFLELDYNPQTGVGYVSAGGIGGSGGGVYHFQNLTVGVEEEALPPSFSAYPNPTSGDLTLRWTGSETAEEAILFDAQGRPSRQWTNVANGRVLRLDVSPGFYTLRLKTAEGTRSQKLCVDH
ncbi:MAG: T9SS type A sorting domain-containing protein [Flavobacteriales bacterium]